PRRPSVEEQGLDRVIRRPMLASPGKYDHGGSPLPDESGHQTLPIEPARSGEVKGKKTALAARADSGRATASRLHLDPRVDPSCSAGRPSAVPGCLSSSARRAT